MYSKKTGRVTFRSNRRPNYKRNNNFSNGKGKNRGNVTQQYNKYLKLAKEASSSGDRIQSEYYYQFTDHYYRLMVELGITIDDNETLTENKNNITNDDQIISTSESESTDQNNDKEEVIDDVFLKSKPIIKEKTNKEDDENVATKANKYIYKGNMREFSKKTINIVMVESKKSKMTFADFKKLTD